MNKVDKFTEQATDITASVVSAPFKIVKGVFQRVFWWV